MKNNLLTEITHIKKLMGLTESSNEECEQQLEKAGYRVYSTYEQKKLDLDCESNEKIKCVKEWLDNNGISTSNYTIGKYRGFCYIMVQSDSSINQDGKNIKEKTWTFWNNGDVTSIKTFPILQVDTEDANLKYSQVQYKGKYECDSSTLSWNNLRYQGVYKFGDTSNLIELDPTYKVTTSSGGKVAIAGIMATNDTFESSNFN